MRIFGKERQSLRINKIQAARAVFINQDVQEVEIRLKTDDGDRLDLQLPSRLVPQLVQQLQIAHEAIHPPMYRGNNAAGWNGME